MMFYKSNLFLMSRNLLLLISIIIYLITSYVEQNNPILDSYDKLD
jgi:hypothetical protein